MKVPFTQQFLKKQREKLLNLKSELLNKTKSQENFAIPSEEIMEEGDLAQAIIGQNVTFELKERELMRLRDIEIALEKFEFGVYGICEETDEPIEHLRLEKMPWASLCIQAAEEREREAKLRM